MKSLKFCDEHNDDGTHAFWDEPKPGKTMDVAIHVSVPTVHVVAFVSADVQEVHCTHFKANACSNWTWEIKKIN